MVSAAVSTQVGYFMQTLVYGLIFVVAIGFFLYSMAFKYMVELNKFTGSGYIVKTFRARKKKDRNGNEFLVGLKLRLTYPKDESFIYKKGRSSYVRYLWFGSHNYHPMKINYNPKNKSREFEAVPQSIKHLYKSDQDNIERKYKEKKKAIEQYGGVIALGSVAIAFVIATYFMTQQIDGAIALGNNVVASAAQCKQVIASSVPPT